MSELPYFDKAERVDLSRTPLKCNMGTEHTKAGERNYLDVNLTEDYSVWGVLNKDRTEAWVEQINLRTGIVDPRIAERLLRGFTMAAHRLGVQALRVPSASPEDLYLFARVFGEQNLTFYEVQGDVSIALSPMTLDQALDSIEKIRLIEESEPHPLIGYFDVGVSIASLNVEGWKELPEHGTI